MKFKVGDKVRWDGRLMFSDGEVVQHEESAGYMWRGYTYEIIKVSPKNALGLFYIIDSPEDMLGRAEVNDSMITLVTESTDG